MDVVASEHELVSRVVRREESRDFVDMTEEFEELVMKFRLKVSSVGTGFALVEVEEELELSLPNAEVEGKVLETTGKQEEMFRLIGDVLVETVHAFFNFMDFCLVSFLFSA